MAVGGEEVTVAGINVEVIQALESGEWIGHRPAPVDLNLRENGAGEGEPPLAFEAREEGGQENHPMLHTVVLLQTVMH
jgi:hypothetical protein